MRYVVTILWLLLLGVSPCAADLRIERTKIAVDPDSEDDAREWPDVLFIGVDGVRRDLASTSVIVRSDADTYIHIDHDARAYVEVPLPLRLEDLLTEADATCLSRSPLALENLEAEVTLTAESRQVGRWKATRVRVRGRHSLGLELEEDLWITHDLPVDLSLYFKMARNTAALSPLSRAWYGDLVAANGFPLESTTTRRMRDRTWRWQRRLDSVTEVEPDPARYRPPAGYTPTLSRPPLDVACVSP